MSGGSVMRSRRSKRVLQVVTVGVETRYSQDELIFRHLNFVENESASSWPRRWFASFGKMYPRLDMVTICGHRRDIEGTKYLATSVGESD